MIPTLGYPGSMVLIPDFYPNDPNPGLILDSNLGLMNGSNPGSMIPTLGQSMIVYPTLGLSMILTQGWNI